MKNTSQRVFISHLLNDFSGSPNICQHVVAGLLKHNYTVYILTSSKENKDGFLGDIYGVHYKIIPYKWYKSKLRTFFHFWKAQMHVFVYLMLKIRQGDLLYCNTVLSIGAVLAGKIRGQNTICHIHEPFNAQKQLQAFLFKILRKLNLKKIFVSAYTMSSFGQALGTGTVLYNTVSKSFYALTPPKKRNLESNGPKILMACSLKPFKGIYNFIQIAKSVPEYNFRLILNANSAEISDFKQNSPELPNLEIFFNQLNMKEHFIWSDLVTNLSIPGQFVETFGLTLLEAFACGRPVIAPPVGGPTEFVKENENGYLISSIQISLIIDKLYLLGSNPDIYNRLSEGARISGLDFKEENFEKKLMSTILIP